MSTLLQVRSGEATVAVDVGPDGRVTIAGAVYAVDEVRPGLYRVTHGDRGWTIAVAGPPDDRWLSVDGHVARIEIAAKGGRRRTSTSPHPLTAPMPATVVKLLVEPGATVRQGETLIVLEAMKMELAVRAPRDGVVRQVQCHVGDLVQPGVALLEID